MQPYPVPSRQVINKFRLAAFWVLVYEGEEAAVVLQTPPVIAVLRLGFSGANMHHFDSPAQMQGCISQLCCHFQHGREVVSSGLTKDELRSQPFHTDRQSIMCATLTL